MYRTVTIVSLCVLVAVLVALVVANSRTKEEELTTESSRLESSDNRTKVQNGTSANPETLEGLNVTSEESGRNITENEDIISEATDFITHANLSQYTKDYNNTIDILKEKRKIIANIQEEINEAETSLKEKQKRLDEIKQRVLAMRLLAEETQGQFGMLITAMNTLQESIVQSSMSANEAFWQLQLQTSKYNDAKRKYSKLASELDVSRSDYKQMKTAVDAASATVKVAIDNMDNGKMLDY